MVNVHFERVNVECLFTPQTGLFASLRGIYEIGRILFQILWLSNCFLMIPCGTRKPIKVFSLSLFNKHFVVKDNSEMTRSLVHSPQGLIGTFFLKCPMVQKHVLCVTFFWFVTPEHVSCDKQHYNATCIVIFQIWTAATKTYPCAHFQ